MLTFPFVQPSLLAPTQHQSASALLPFPNILFQTHSRFNCCCCYYYYTRVYSTTTWVSRYQKGKTSLDLNELRDDEVSVCSGISWTICKQSASRSRHITTPTPHYSIFTHQTLFLMPNQRHQSTEDTLNLSITQCNSHAKDITWHKHWRIGHDQL